MTARAPSHVRRASLPSSGEGPTSTARLDELAHASLLREHAESFAEASGLQVFIRAAGGDVVVTATPRHAEVLESTEYDVSSELTVRTCDDGSYFVATLEHDLEEVGWVVIGPVVGDREPATKLAKHFLESLGVVLHAGQRALYAARMHTASLEDGYQELLRKNEELEEAYARLKQLDHLKSNFLGTVSHELRTPLTSIIGYSDMLASGMAGALTREQLEFVETIRVRGDQLLKLILSLLDLSKLESGTLRMHPIALPMEGVVRDALSTMRPAAAKKGVELAVKVDGELREVRVDPDRLRQVFVNLLDNAVKFTPRGGRVVVELREVEAPAEEGIGFALLAPIQRELEVRVSDTGVGIPAHERARIFDAFYQVDQSSTREQGGAGLGLAIVKRLVEAHQGRIRVEAVEPTGTAFVLSFPLSSVSGRAA